MSGRMRPSSPGIRLAILCVVLLNGWLCLHFIRDKIHRNGSQDVVRNVNNYWTGSSAINSTMVAITEDTTPVLIEPLFPCQNSIPHPYHWQTGTYHILFNYVLADSQFRCDESITYTTHGDFTFLDNLEPLTQRWKGPVSIAMFAPGSDFTRTLEAIQYARECFSEEVRQLVTFHLVLPEHHQPEIKGLIPNRENILSQVSPPNCSMPFPFSSTETYKKSKSLTYPVNVARNAARTAATTYFVLPSDIELYPSKDVIPAFLQMVRDNPKYLDRSPPKVFVFSIFEVKSNVTPPLVKSTLLELLKKGDAIPFHSKLCGACHNIPKAEEWRKLPPSEGIHVMHVAKREKKFQHWEPIYIGTKDDPQYDERLSWEGMSDKMTQMYILCVLNYELNVLDNAFLVHRPGIKSKSAHTTRRTVASKQTHIIRSVIIPELNAIYGTKKECSV